MNCLFIDTINTVLSELESNTLQILTINKKTSDKIEMLNLQLAEFKNSVLGVLGSFVKGYKNEGKGQRDNISIEIDN